MIPEGGFRDDEVGGFQSKTFKSMKTQDLADQRKEEKLELDDTK